MNEIILASSNPGKLKELNALLHPIYCINQDSLGIISPPETGVTFLENALIKARHASQESSKPALADDSGLVVPFLNGEPGIYSARYAGEHASDTTNCNILLGNLDNTSESQRKAFFYCAIVLVRYPLDPTPLIAFGQINGLITQQAQGKNGFGYDPLFYLTDYGCTMAELAPDVKNTISHRAKALQQLKTYLSYYE